MPVSIMESSALPSESQNGKSTETVPAGSLLDNRSAYMANMVLPEIVQSSKNHPLGPDCTITYSDNPDQSLLVNMDLYWFISLEKGCVECKVNVQDTGHTRTATTADPKVIITRKPRRFEAYSCFICRANFVTVVQALLHVKAFHRQNLKILIQDQNVFHDIDKAMEVPPVPLPWYVAKKQQSIHNMSSTIPVSNDLSESDSSSTHTAAPTRDSTSDEEANPVTTLLQAIVKEYGKQVQHVLFGKDFSEVRVGFEDRSHVIAHLPDLVSHDGEENLDEANMSEKLEYQVYRMTADTDDEESCVVRVNNPLLAQKLIITALKKGVSERNMEHDDSSSKEPPVPEPPVSPTVADESQMEKDRKTDSPSAPAPVKLDSRGRPTKTVRFMVGNPDSDDDGNSSSNEKPDKEDQMKSVTSSQGETGVVSNKAKEDEGLKGVVSQLISTASKGLMVPVDPVSPVSSSSAKVREEILATAALHARFLPKNSSVPNLANVAGGPVTTASPTPATTSQSSGMIRVQSWGGSADPQQFRLSTYAPHTPQNFENMTREELRRSFLTVGRAFTYAEKIKLMKKLNDEDSIITQEHVRDAGKLAVATITPTTSKAEKKKAKKLATTTISSNSQSPQPLASALALVGSQDKRRLSEGEGSGVDAIRKAVWAGERKKRRSKYDVDHLVVPSSKPDTGALNIEKSKQKRHQSSSEGSVSDHEVEDSNNSDVFDDKDAPPSLLDVMRTAYPTVLTSRSGSLFSGQRLPNVSSYPSMLTSEYYGSGEWANAAMQTLQKLQTSVDSATASSLLPPKLSQDLKLEADDNDDDDGSGSSTPPFVNVNPSDNRLFDAVNAETVQKPDDLPSAIRANSEQMVLALAEQIRNEKDANAMNQHRQRKRALSPPEIDSGLTHTKTKSQSEHPKKKAKQSSHGSRSTENSSKKRSRQTDPAEGTSQVVAEKGDGLEFTGEVTSQAFDKNVTLSLKFQKGSLDKSATLSDAGGSMDMPQIFENSVETFMKVKLVEKVSACRVCGFTVNASDTGSASTIRAHVMEHSLKDLLQTGYNGKQ